MTIQERIDEAIRLEQSKDNEEAANIWEELGRETLDSVFFRAAIANYNLEGFPYLMIDAPQLALEYSTKSLELCDFLETAELKTRHDEDAEEITKLYSRACYIKGRASFDMNKSNLEAIKYLEEAAQYGDSDAEFYSGIYYVVNKVNPEEDMNGFIQNASMRTHHFERFIELSTNEANPERLETACEWLVIAYEHGLGVEANIEKSNYYKNILENIKA